MIPFFSILAKNFVRQSCETIFLGKIKRILLQTNLQAFKMNFMLNFVKEVW